MQKKWVTGLLVLDKVSYSKCMFSSLVVTTNYMMFWQAIDQYNEVGTLHNHLYNITKNWPVSEEILILS